MRIERDRSAKARAARLLCTPLGVAAHLGRSVLTRARRPSPDRRPSGFRWPSGPGASRPGHRPGGTRVLAVVTHVTPPAPTLAAEAAAAHVERLSRSLDALFRSFAHCDLRVVVNTHAGRHLLDRLPAGLRARLEVCEHADGDPWFVEFRAQQVFVDAADADDADWFLFVEDDILVHDACFLEKLDLFNRAAADPARVLLPHRYEMAGAAKVYIDRGMDDDGANRHSERTAVRATGVAFVEFENPHAATYCLSREQVRLWARSPRRWYGKVSWIGPLESAATGCLMECFTLYKPHPAHARYLEVQHWGEKYAARAGAVAAGPAVPGAAGREPPLRF